jgi:cytidine deaminase
MSIIDTDYTKSRQFCKKFSDSLYEHMEDMIDLRLARNSDGSPCIALDKNNLHIAMVFEESGNNIIPLTFGQNWASCTISYHAEHNAIRKLTNRDSKKLQNVNIFVLRTTLAGTIGSSSPCSHCLAIMCTLAKKKGYKINDVYFTNSDREIERKKLTELLKEPPYLSRYYLIRNYKPKLEEL